jgi:lipopolysaccharide transport system permease protein
MAVIVRSAQTSPWWQDLHPARPVALLWRQRQLLQQLVVRELKGRYRGSILGSVWSVLLPVLAVAVYTVVFGFLLKSKWPGQESGWSFALLVFAGLACFNAFAEVVQRSTSVILAQPNLVKKVVFPLDILPALVLGTALVPLLVSMFVVCLGLLLTSVAVQPVYLIIALIPFLLWLQGLGWFLAGIGTFLRDLGPMVAAVCPLLMFLTPLFYPASIVPEAYQWLVWINPLAVVVETVRAGLAGAVAPPGWAWVWLMVTSLVTWQGGYWVFTRLRPEMADVV